ncbi:UDP-N-acetylmuramoyl-L-alanyl-D-glutamate--2,6-diaminopimelate ligase [Candidatus Peregrinibacteria bacterium]|nr:UDP-N-acetylmuramoyl-L-alanyl-D-glutamate--2,6-diaminopimelate ligase [Candidatus Peregrinibacteria bacterium]
MLALLRNFFPKNSFVRKIWYYLKAIFALIRYDFPSQKLKMVAITGTDGKTTTVEMISQILKEANIRHLKISTVSIHLDGTQTENTSKRTTLSPLQMGSLLRKAVDSHVEIAVIEVSSHAIDQGRIFGMSFDIAGITNISEEHLDDHGGFAKYILLKEKLFRHYLKKKGIAVLSKDDEVVLEMDSRIRKIKKWYSSYGDYSADFVSTHLVETQKGIEFSLMGERLQMPILGKYNVQNATLAFAIATLLNISPKVIVEGLRKFSGVPGRLEKIEKGQNFEVYVDFAVTANALKEVLHSLKNITQGNIWVVFGCTGDRDRSKREQMGKIAGTIADFVVLTDDETYTENGEAIREEVKKGIQKTTIWNQSGNVQHFWEIPDRYEAITFALKNAQKGDAIIITGIGAETSRNMGGKEIPWNDRKVVEEILQKM